MIIITLQILGIIIPILCILFLGIISLIETYKGKGDEVIPTWMLLLLLLSILILGFTLGTIAMSYSL